MCPCLYMHKHWKGNSVQASPLKGATRACKGLFEQWVTASNSGLDLLLPISVFWNHASSLGRTGATWMDITPIGRPAAGDTFPTYCPQKLTPSGKVSDVSSLDSAACDFKDGESYHITGNTSSETSFPLWLASNAKAKLKSLHLNSTIRNLCNTEHH